MFWLIAFCIHAPSVLIETLSPFCVFHLCGPLLSFGIGVWYVCGDLGAPNPHTHIITPLYLEFFVIFSYSDTSGTDFMSDRVVFA